MFFRFPDRPFSRYGLNLLTKILNGESSKNYKPLVAELNYLREAMKEENLASLPELQKLLLEEKQILLDHLAKPKLMNPPSNEGKAMPSYVRL